MNGMPSAPDSWIKLHGPADWDLWFTHLKLWAQVEHIWKHCDPDAVDMVMAYEPEEPQLKDVQDVQQASHLAAKDRADWAELLREYQADMAQYDQYRRAEMILLTWVKKSVARHWLPDLAKMERVRDALLYLSAVLEPSVTGYDLRQRWQQVQQIDTNTDFTQWIKEWHIAYHKAKSAGLPEVAGSLAYDALLNAVRPYSNMYWGFITRPLQAVEHEQLQAMKPIQRPPIVRLLEMLLHAHKQAEIGFEAPEVSARAATLLGPPQPNQSPSFGSKPGSEEERAEQLQQGRCRACFCGVPHRWRDCPYIFADRRPPAWKPDHDIARSVNHAKQVNRTLQTIVKRVANGTYDENYRSKPKGFRGRRPGGHGNSDEMAFDVSGEGAALHDFYTIPPAFDADDSPGGPW